MSENVMGGPLAYRVFVNGVFDPVTAGHAHLLHEAMRAPRPEGKRLRLHVGIASDAYAKELKGGMRPVMLESDRWYLIQAIAPKATLWKFSSEDELRGLVRLLEVDLLVKGEDYRDKPITGRQYVEERGGSVLFVPRMKFQSASEIVRRSALCVFSDLVEGRASVDESGRW